MRRSAGRCEPRAPRGPLVACARARGTAVLLALVAAGGAPAALLTGLFVVFVPLRVCEDAGPLHLALEPPERAVERLIFADSHLGHRSTPSASLSHSGTNTGVTTAQLYTTAEPTGNRSARSPRRCEQCATLPRGAPLVAARRHGVEDDGTRVTVTRRTTRSSFLSAAPFTAKSHPHVLLNDASETRIV
jgi:hypothetical protein